MGSAWRVKTVSRESYLEQLSRLTVDGLARLPTEFRSRHAGYLIARQNPDGGFSGREGGSDLYYTSFALRSLAALNALSPEICRNTAGYLTDSLARQTSVVDFFSFLYSRLVLQVTAGIDVFTASPAGWPDRVAAMLETLHTPDGGYDKTPRGASGSTYHTFLVGMTYQLLSRPIPRAEQVIQFVASRRRDDGGYVEIGPMRRSGANPTAAAIGILQLIETQEADSAILTSELREGVSGFLTSLQSEEGGLRANSRIPLADLLSTFTGLWTLHQLGAIDRVDRNIAGRYAHALELPTGGFRGGLWDDATDVEYTFYGLGTLALLAV
jgi:geranylgeranyl transferase type-2 subunit beta